MDSTHKTIALIVRSKNPSECFSCFTENNSTAVTAAGVAIVMTTTCKEQLTFAMCPFELRCCPSSRMHIKRCACTLLFTQNEDPGTHSHTGWRKSISLNDPRFENASRLLFTLSACLRNAQRRMLRRLRLSLKLFVSIGYVEMLRREVLSF